MKRVRVVNRERGTELGDRVRVADRWWPRLRGMIGRPPPRAGEGLLITESRGVHMWWMKYPLDVAILDDEGTVVALYPELAPGTRTKLHRRGRFALELPAGALESTGTSVGDTLSWEEHGSAAEESGTDRSVRTGTA